MRLACLDFESVLVPELWPALGQALEIPELLLTTRQVSDKLELNRVRLGALKKHKVTVRQIEKILSKVKPLPGACGFLRWLGARMPFVIVSDCFYGMALPLLKKLKGASPLCPPIICHQWKTRQGRVVGLPMTRKSQVADPERRAKRAVEGQDLDSKSPVVRAFQKLGFKVFATGDSLNDLGMLRAAELSCWFRPSPRALASAPKLRVSQTYSDLKKVISTL